jgi:chromosome partitioning protein
MSKQIIVSILANAGGVGKSTLATHLAYELSKHKLSIALIDLDPQHSLDVFCGLAPARKEESIIQVLTKDFQGEWQLTKAWDNPDIQVCRAHPELANMAQELVLRKRGEYVLADRLNKYSLPHNIILIDCPATWGTLCENAIAASTYLLIPIQLESKAIAGLNDLIQKIIILSEELALSPSPSILGCVPSMFDKEYGMHRQYLDELPATIEKLQIKCYPAIRASAEFKNASAFGLPLHLYRPGHKANKDFQELGKTLVNLFKNA